MATSRCRFYFQGDLHDAAFAADDDCPAGGPALWLAGAPAGPVPCYWGNTRRHTNRTISLRAFCTRRSAQSVSGKFSRIFEILSNIGLILFLFLIGSELDYAHLRKQRKTAVFASLLSIFFPFGMAAMVAHSLRIRFAPDGIGRVPFVLFLGISMSITAFPVLARILEERKLQSTSLGATALMCAAVDDVAAWTLLAFTLTLLGGGEHTMTMPVRLLWLGFYLLVMLGLIRPLGAWFVRRQNAVGLSYELLGIIIAVVLGVSCGDGGDRGASTLRRVHGRTMFSAHRALAGGGTHTAGHAGVRPAVAAVFSR